MAREIGLDHFGNEFFQSRLRLPAEHPERLAGVALDESAAAAPMNTYAATKAAADLALGAMVNEGLRVIRLRPFNHTGPGQSPDFVVPAFARQIARIETGLQPPVMRTGALAPRRDFLDVRDVYAAYIACLQRADTLASGNRCHSPLRQAHVDN